MSFFLNTSYFQHIYGPRGTTQYCSDEEQKKKKNTCDSNADTRARTILIAGGHDTGAR